MIGMQNERDIERVTGLLRLRFSAHQVKEMFRLGQIVAHGWK